MNDDVSQLLVFKFTMFTGFTFGINNKHCRWISSTCWPVYKVYYGIYFKRIPFDVHIIIVSKALNHFHKILCISRMLVLVMAPAGPGWPCLAFMYPGDRKVSNTLWRLRETLTALSLVYPLGFTFHRTTPHRANSRSPWSPSSRTCWYCPLAFITRSASRPCSLSWKTDCVKMTAFVIK